MGKFIYRLFRLTFPFYNQGKESAYMKFVDSLKKTNDFKKVYNHHHSKANRLFIMYIMKNDSSDIHLGISVSKKVGNSVVRHRMTRLVREVFRLNQNKVIKGYDIIVIVRPSAKGHTYQEFESGLFHLLKLHKLWST